MNKETLTKKEKIADYCELPKDVVLGASKLTTSNDIEHAGNEIANNVTIKIQFFFIKSINYIIELK